MVVDGLLVPGSPRSADTDAITQGRTVTATFHGTFSPHHPPLRDDCQQVSAPFQRQDRLVVSIVLLR